MASIRCFLLVCVLHAGASLMLSAVNCFIYFYKDCCHTTAYITENKRSFNLRLNNGDMTIGMSTVRTVVAITVAFSSSN